MTVLWLVLFPTFYFVICVLLTMITGLTITDQMSIPEFFAVYLFIGGIFCGILSEEMVNDWFNRKKTES